MKTRGIVVHSGNGSFFAGKIGVAPHHNDVPAMRGHPIFYREVNYADTFSTKTQAISVDKSALDTAIAAGARTMVVYCPDEGMLMFWKTRNIINAVVVDLGAMPQYRIPLSDVAVVRNTYPLSMVWTDDLIHTYPASNELNVKPKDVQMKLWQEDS